MQEGIVYTKAQKQGRILTSSVFQECRIRRAVTEWEELRPN